jgi:hypothetical protein
MISDSNQNKKKIKGPLSTSTYFPNVDKSWERMKRCISNLANNNVGYLESSNSKILTSNEVVDLIKNGLMKEFLICYIVF